MSAIEIYSGIRLTEILVAYSRSRN